MLLKDILTIDKNSINPLKFKNDYFFHFSLPAFDKGKHPDYEKGEKILSTKFKLNKPCILFNKLNVRFKRIWNLHSVENNYICSSEFLPLFVKNINFLQDYIYYYLLSDKVNSLLMLDINGTSASHQRIDTNTLLNIPIKHISIQEQQHIVDIIPTHSLISL